MLLNCLSYYSLKYGVLSIESVIDVVRRYGYKEIVLTEINTTSSFLSYMHLARQKNIKAFCGVDVRNGDDKKYILIAKNRIGFYLINEFLNNHINKNIDFPDRAPELKDVYIIYPFKSYKGETLKRNEFIGVRPSELNKLTFFDRPDILDKLIACPECVFIKKKDYEIHKNLRAIAKNTLITRLRKEGISDIKNVYLPKNVFIDYYKDKFRLLDNVKFILNSSQLDIPYKTYKNHQNKERYLET